MLWAATIPFAILALVLSSSHRASEQKLLWILSLSLLILPLYSDYVRTKLNYWEQSSFLFLFFGFLKKIQNFGKHYCHWIARRALSFVLLVNFPLFHERVIACSNCATFGCSFPNDSIAIERPRRNSAKGKKKIENPNGRFFGILCSLPAWASSSLPCWLSRQP